MQHVWGNIFMWFLPALPAVLASLAAWLIDSAKHRREYKDWMRAHYGRVAGILIFALSFALAPVGVRQYVLNFRQTQWPIHAGELLSLLLCIGLLTWLQRSKRGSVQGLEKYAEANMGTLSLTLYSVTWIVYLLCYEVYFRGYLLTMAFPEIHIVPVIAYNLVLYSLVHLTRNLQQALLSIPFGLLLCIVTITTNHLWFAVIVHCWLALGVELPLLTMNRNHKILTR
jgi:membrane protease YdiL (CAAX protease family)